MCWQHHVMRWLHCVMCQPHSVMCQPICTTCKPHCATCFWKNLPTRQSILIKLLFVWFLTLNVHWMYIECTLNTHWIHIEYTLNTYWNIPTMVQYILNIGIGILTRHWMYIEYTLNYCKTWCNTYQKSTYWIPTLNQSLKMFHFGTLLSII